MIRRTGAKKNEQEPGQTSDEATTDESTKERTAKKKWLSFVQPTVEPMQVSGDVRISVYRKVP